MAKGSGIKFLSNFISSGKTSNPDETLRYTVFNFALMAGGTFLFIFGASVSLGGNFTRAIFNFFVGGLCFTTIGLLRTKLPLQIPGGVAIGAFGILCALLISTGELNGVVALWVFAFPMISIFVLGLQMGIIYSVLLFCAIVSFTIIPGLSDNSYNLQSASRFIAVYVLVTYLTITYEYIRLIKDRQVNLLNHELRVERDIIAAMKDNLKAGLFLMNKDYEIQGAYSKRLEDILGTDEIEGQKLTEFLTSSLKAKERETLEDYFNMVLLRQFDPKMLEEINPISEFTYVNNTDRDRKTLQTGFSTVDMGLNNIYVLGTMEDISATKELQRQLELEAGRREEEMKALFQVIQVDPAVFGDFLDDTETEFEHINNILKDKTLNAKDAMIYIYQSVHAIKSNALILGLDNFSSKLHELENKIRGFRDGDDVVFENVLHIAVELEKIMKEKDRFRDIIVKIQSFQSKTGGKRRQDRYVLVETLTKACEKAAIDQEKNVVFVVDELDGSILEHGPRRIIKEVLTQLVRNSVYHGIELPSERENKGKESQGNIRLSITRDNNFYCLKLSDNGKGLNFDKIREKALNLKLISEKDADNTNKLVQVLFSPGFSTADTADLHAGRGIGLNLVRERIKAINGSIRVSSEPGKGTTFSLYIPLTQTAESKAS